MGGFHRSVKVPKKKHEAPPPGVRINSIERIAELEQFNSGAYATARLAALERKARGNLIAFNTIGHDVALGLDFEMPFVRVPIGRHLDKNGQPKAMMTINTGAIVTTTLLAGGGLLVGFLLRSLGIQGTGTHPVYDTHGPATKHDDATTGANAKEHADAGETAHKAARHLNDGGAAGDGRGRGGSTESLVKAMQALKMVYTNATGDRVEITLPQLYEQLEIGFAERDVDLQACIWQSLCTLVQQSHAAMQAQHASAAQKIIDGITQMPWLLAAVRHTAIGDVIQAATAQSTQRKQCIQQYAACNLHAPQEKLMQLLHTHVQFA